ncbi:MAG: CCA tRNA nucleotidyltransferase [Cohaesibacteraceae bacterium]
MNDPLTGLLQSPGVARLFDVLETDGDQLWLVGGCVRNALLSEPHGDLDFATQAEPKTVMERADAAGLKAVPTGIDHGTITVIVDHVPFEVTTLRRDVETDGRRAVVAFSRDLAEDAARRDFTMNALYVDRQAQLHDPREGLADLEARRVRFIGDAGERLREDYLRALRFFRFYGWYGHGAPDREAVRAIVANKNGLEGLSAERVWSELKKLLAAPNVTRALLWMRQTGVYQIVLPESGDMDGFARFMRLEESARIAPDPLLRLLALLPLRRPDAETVLAGLASRLKLSGAERDRLMDAANLYHTLDLASLGDAKARRAVLYQHEPSAVLDAALVLASHGLDADPESAMPSDVVDRLVALREDASAWKKPSLPISGQDLIDRGIPTGPQGGEALKMMEGAWVASDFSLSREDLLAVLKT